MPLRIKNIITNAALTLGGVVVAVVIGEIALRIGLPYFEPASVKIEENDPVVHPDPLLGLAIVPGSYEGHNDARGFKNRVAFEQADIVALGDSQTYGPLIDTDGVDYSWPAELSRIASTTTYNMGVWGYGTGQYSALLDEALSLHPKAVVVGMWSGNDIFDAYDLIYHHDSWAGVRNPNFANSAPQTVEDSKQLHTPLREVRQWVRDRSVLYKTLGDRTRIWREEVGIASPRTIGTRDWSDTNPDASLLFDARPELRTLFWSGHRVAGVDVNDPNVLEGLRLTKEFLVDMNTRAKAKGVKLVVIVYPSKMSAYDELVRAANLSNPLFMKIVKDEAWLKEEILTTCKGGDILCVDALPTFQAELGAGKKMYKENWDEHSTSAGYEVYAKVAKDA
ncbi:MAG: hypothetical protein Q7S86_05375, partial [bacterium]|nr:hypothetical protein [bacterium]